MERITLQRRTGNSGVAPPPFESRSVALPPEYGLHWLLQIKGLGKTVATRIVTVATTASDFLDRWKTPESLAGDIKGVSPSGAQKIIEAVQETFGGLSVSEPTVTNPFPALTSVQLQALLNTNLPDAKKQAIKAYLDSLSQPAEPPEQEDSAPTLPPAYQGFNPEQLQILLPTLEGDDLVKVTAYLSSLDTDDSTDTEEVDEAEDDEDEEFTEPVETPVTITTAAPPVSSTVDFFRRATMRQGQNTLPGGKVEFLKLSATRTTIRLLPADNAEQPPFAEMRVHNYRKDGKFNSVLDLGWVVNTPHIRELLVKAGKLSQSDIDKISTLGDPMQMLPVRLSQADRKEEAKNFWSRYRYLWNVLDKSDGKVKVYESSQGFFKQIATFDDEGNLTGGLLSLYPDLLSLTNGRDLVIQGNGQNGTSRKYSAPLPMGNPTKADISDQSLFNLTEIVVWKYMPLAEKVETFFQLYSTQAAAVGLTFEQYM